MVDIILPPTDTPSSIKVFHDNLGHVGNVSIICTAVRVVAVSRTDQSLADLRQKLGNPSKDKLVTVQGNLCEQPS